MHFGLVLLVGIGFLAGLIAALTPCVLPVLPVLFAGGSSGRKPVRIVTGLLTGFVVFTLSATWLLDQLGLPQDLLRNIAIAFLFIFAATLLVPWLGTLSESLLAPLTRFRAGGGGFLLGVSLALVFTPCAGPALAAIVTAGATDHVGWRAVLLTVAYAVGLAGPMLLFARGGVRLGASLRAHAAVVRFASGVTIALVAAAITFNVDTTVEEILPNYAPALQRHVEDTASAARVLQTVYARKSIVQQTPTTDTTPIAQAGPGASSLPILAPSAPPITAGGDWFNSRPLTIAGLRGKVVLVDFWTYSCINCLRTIPHLEAWYKAYARYGLVIIGVHSPEFAFEHVASNVAAAVKRLGITYPVVQDNNFATWDAYGNEYWPADYLIDQQGRIRAYTYGEGNYGELETDIRQLLGVSDVAMTTVPNMTPTEQMTAEAYLGYTRLDPARYVGAAIADNRIKDYPQVSSVPLNSVSYSGTWLIRGEMAIAGKDAGITLDFQGKDVYMVLSGRGRVTVRLAGEPTTTIEVTADRLYTLTTSRSYRTGVLRVTLTPGLDAYSFTFG